MQNKYIVGSGWWCSAPEQDTRDILIGDNKIRSRDFHHTWYQSICRSCNPQKIIIIDSNSPIPPPTNKQDKRIEYISLNTNAGHSTNHTGKFCGYMRAILLGIEYAAQCDTDYYVYIEQDALLKGKDLIDYCINQMTTPYMFGSGEGTPQQIQQSFFIIRRDGFNSFVNRIKAINACDNEISPEEKFVISTLTNYRKTAEYLALKNFHWRQRLLKEWIYTKYRGYDHLPIGYGRCRPINFNETHYYFQHASALELEQYALSIHPN